MPTPEAWQKLESASGQSYAVDELRLLAPVQPRKIICIGLNYRDHAAESELAIPEVPVIFAKWPTAMVGPGDDIVIPREETRPDYEAELGARHRPARHAARPAPTRSRAIGGITCVPRRLRPPRPARDAAAPVHVGQELRHLRAHRPGDHEGRRARPLEPEDQGHPLRRDDAGLEHVEPHLRPRAARRVLLDGHDAGARRRHRDRHARRRRRRQEAAAVPASEGDTFEIWVEHVGSLVNPVVLER